MDATKITTVELREVDLAHARQILFEQLRDAARVLAEKAELAAYGGNADEDNLEGDNAHAQYRHQVQAIAQLLDQLGWSVLTDTATIVEYERACKTSRGA
jgi:hypothetical protein